MTFRLKLTGALRYADAAAAALARAAMIEVGAGNTTIEDGSRVVEDGSRVVEDGSRVVEDAIVFSFDGALSTASASAVVGGAERAIAKALETAITGSVTYSDERGHERVRHALGREFWAKRWDEGQTAFHEGAPNELLVRHAAALERRREARSGPCRILVPLAGKSIDMQWLAHRGYEVVGIEVHWGAVRAFFDEQEADPPIVEIGAHRSMSANGVTLICADIFEAAPGTLGTFDVVYDRAALVALEPSTRARYVATCRSLLADGGITLLIAFSYDQTKAPGPPWSIDLETVRSLYSPAHIEVLETRAVPTSKRLTAAGISVLEESAYLIGGA